MMNAETTTRGPVPAPAIPDRKGLLSAASTGLGMPRWLAFQGRKGGG